jgi:predicted dehydrogenase
LNKQLKVGVIGCGGIAQMMHLPFLADRTDLFDIVALCDADERTLEIVSKRYHVTNAFSDYKALLDMPVDAVLLLHSGTHSEQVVAAASAGKHVFSEKPLAFSPAEASWVAEAVQRAGITLMVGYMKRYDPAYLQAKQLVKELQDLRFVQINVWHPDDAAYRTHYNLYPVPVAHGSGHREGNLGLVDLVTKGPIAERIEEAIGESAPMIQRIGYFLMCGSLIHQINALRGILGEPEGIVSTQFWRGGAGIASTLRYSPDFLCTLTWVSLPGVKNYQEQYLFLAPESRIGLEFPSPYLRHFPTKLSVQGMDGEKAWNKEMTVSYREAFHEELLRFHDCVVSGAEPPTGIEDALKDAELIVQMAQAYSE